MNIQNTSIVERLCQRFMQEFLQSAQGVDAKVQSTIADCFRRNIDNMARFTVELQNLSISQEMKSDLLAIYGRCVSGRNSSEQTKPQPLAPGKRSGDPLESESIKRQCLQPTRAEFEKNIPLIKEWIQKGEVNFIEKSFDLVGGYAQASNEQLIEVCHTLVDLLKNEDWTHFNSLKLSTELFTPLQFMMQVNDIHVVLAASACFAELYWIKAFIDTLKTCEFTEAYILLLEEAMAICLNTPSSTKPLSSCMQKFAKQPEMTRALLVNLCRGLPYFKNDNFEYEHLVKIVEDLFTLLKSPPKEVMATVAICLARLSCVLQDQFKEKPLNIAERCFERILPMLESEDPALISESLAVLGRLIWHNEIWKKLQEKNLLPKIGSLAFHKDDHVVLSLVSGKDGLLAALLTHRGQADLLLLKNWIEPLLACLSHANLQIVQDSCWLLGTCLSKNLIDSEPAYIQNVFDTILDKAKASAMACHEAVKRGSENPSQLSSSASQLEKTALFCCRCIMFLKTHMTIQQAEKILRFWLDGEGFPFSTKLTVWFLCYLGPLFADKKEWDQYALSFHERCLPLFFKNLSHSDHKGIEAALWGLEKLAQNPTTAKLILAQFDWEYAFKLLNNPSSKVKEGIIKLMSKMIETQTKMGEVGKRLIKKCLEMIDEADPQLKLIICRNFLTTVKLPGFPVLDGKLVREKVLNLLRCEKNPASLLFQETAYWCLGNMLLKPEFRQASDVEEMWPLLHQTLFLPSASELNAEINKAVEAACFCVCNLLQNCDETKYLELVASIVHSAHPKVIEANLWLLYRANSNSLNKEDSARAINLQFAHFIVNHLSSTSEAIVAGALWCTLGIVLRKINQKFFFPIDFLEFILDNVGDILQRSKDKAAVLALRVMKILAEISPAFAGKILEHLSRAKYSIARMIKTPRIERLELIAALCSLQTVKDQLNATSLVELLKVLHNANSSDMHPSALIILKSFQPALLQNDRDAIIEVGSRFLMGSLFPEVQPEKSGFKTNVLQDGNQVAEIRLESDKKAIKEKQCREAAIAFLADYVPLGSCNLPLDVLSEKAQFLLTCLQTGDSAHLVETARLLVSFVVAGAGAVNIADSHLEQTLLMHPQPEIGKEVLPLLEMLFKNDPSRIFPLLQDSAHFKALCSFPPSDWQEKVQTLVQGDHKLVSYWEEKALHNIGSEHLPLALWLYRTKEEGLQRLAMHLKKTPSVHFFLNALQLCSQLNLGTELLEPHPALKPMPFLQHDATASETYAMFYGDRDYKDFALKVGRETIPCHKIILTQSPYFRAVLPEVLAKGELELDQIDASIIKQVVEFMYLKKLHVTSIQQVLSCLEAAQKYVIEDLELFCISILKDLLHPETFSTIFDFACGIDCATLVDYATDWLLINYGRFSDAQRLEIAARWENLGD